MKNSIIWVTQWRDCSLEAYLDLLVTCVQSGVSAVQLREKTLKGDRLYQYAKALNTCLKQLAVPLIVNDNLDLCQKIDAAGLHLGQDDGSVLEARERLGPKKLIGLSINSLSQIQQANQLPIDYIGVGPVFATTNKFDAVAPLGLETLKEAANQSSHPVVAIGGIDPSNAKQVMETGVLGIAAIAAFHCVSDPARVAQLFERKIIFSEINRKNPLILNLTNTVTMDLMANALLAIAAAPLMSECESEMEELVVISSALVINIGTLSCDFIKRCLFAAEVACKLGKPVILDPVGAGASKIRTEAAKQLMPFVSIVKGNASEILALVDPKTKSKGVESIHSIKDAKQAALQLAQEYSCTVVVSGKIDFICDGESSLDVHGGSPLMSRITGMGCALAAIVASFSAVVPDPFDAAAKAIGFYNDCGRKAALKANHPGSFRSEFIGCLYDQ